MINAFKKLTFVMAVLCLMCCSPDGGNARGPIMPRDTLVVQSADDGTEYLFHVEMALTKAHQEHGLMHRESMPDNAGMLFVFNGEAKRSFWMKNTLIPLDMIFIARDGTVKHIHHMAKPLDENGVTSRHPAFAVLEINGGLSDKYGITVGDKVLHERFRNAHMETIAE